MTYFNGNPYRERITAVAHDECLPEDQIDTVTLTRFDGSTYTHSQQKQPWHWAPIWGRPDPCEYCGRAVR